MTRHLEVLIVGAGPAGIAAATSAARCGKRVGVLDENPQPGGQIWRHGVHDEKRKLEAAKQRTFDDFHATGSELFGGHHVVDAPAPHSLSVWNDLNQSLETFAYDKLILATGARERFLPFPGWTLPGVFGAGGLQALARTGYDIRRKRVVVSGTGPLLLAVAAHLKEDGAEVVTIAEQAPLARMARFARSLLRHPSKISQAIHLKSALLDVPYRMGCWPVAALGSDHLTGVQLTDGSSTWTEACDLLACGFHLVPNTELASLLGCSIGDRGIIVDANQQTSVPDVFSAGESTGIAGVDSAILQGHVAGLAASGALQEADRLHARRDSEAAIGLAMDRAFALRPELLSVPQPETIICRCEDVRLRDLQPQSGLHTTWTDAKLQTRCGMGPCQGRICAPALQALFGWRNTSVRPPISPVPLSAFCSDARPTELSSTAASGAE